MSIGNQCRPAMNPLVCRLSNSSGTLPNVTRKLHLITARWGAPGDGSQDNSAPTSSPPDEHTISMYNHDGALRGGAASASSGGSRDETSRKRAGVPVKYADVE